MRRNVLVLLAAVSLPAALSAQWPGYGRDAQHTARSNVAAQTLGHVKWSAPVDALNVATTGSLLIHYGSPAMTAANTVLVPNRDSGGVWRVSAFDGAVGTFKYNLIPPTPYTPPSSSWTPSYSGALNVRNRFFYPCSGGTICYRDTPDSNSGASGQLVFYGAANYFGPNQSALDSSVRVSTPIATDRYGTIFFGFEADPGNPLGLVSGIARIPVAGSPSWASAPALASDASMKELQVGSAPALSNDHTALYFAVSTGGGGVGYLLRVNATTLTTLSSVRLKDPKTGNDAVIWDISTASPTIGTDGDVFFGVWEGPNTHARGWMLHFDSTLAALKTPGAFGWDTTASIVNRTLVPQYVGPSPYLILTKYNDYGSAGGTGINRVAVLDPDTAAVDPITGINVMAEVITVAGVTPDPTFPQVKEWCINSAAIDLVTKSAMINSEDGTLYRWDFTSNTLSQSIALTSGRAEAYTPTLIGPDGTVYAINDAVLFAVSQ